MVLKQLQRFTDDYDRRWYYVDGTIADRSSWYISVTTVLKEVVVPIGLQNYMRDHAAEDQNEILERRSQEGTSFHDLVEADLRGLPYTVTPEQQGAFDEWLRIKKEHGIRADEFEIGLCSDQWGYAGTCDTIGLFDEQRVVLDFKTGRSREKDKYQLAAYRNAFYEETGELLGMVAIMLPQRGEGKPIVYRHYDYCFRRFLDAMGLWRDYNYYGNYHNGQFGLKDMNWRWLHTERVLTPQ